MTWGLRHLLQKQVWQGPEKSETCTDFVTKSRTTLNFLQQLFATFNNLISCKTGLNVGGKRATPLFNLFCSNDAKQAARFCCSFYRSIIGSK